MRFIPLIVVALATYTSVAMAVDTRQAQVNRAIEQTKSRQMSSAVVRAPPSRASQNPPGRSESLDVDKLNQLIRVLDKTWIMPRAGSKDPVGSNFQYKKTCASIFKARHGACQQLGFGVMCFNYCFERGEKLSFRCQDASDAAYCRQSGTFETFLAKYSKDGYKAKAYIHQMISRCYATAICNTQTGILNSTLISDQVEQTQATTKMNRLRLLTRGPKTSKPKTTTPAPSVDTDYVEESLEEVTTTTKRRPSEKKKTTRTRAATTTTAPPKPVTASKSNIWDRFTVSQNSKVSSKYIPFWKRLLSTTISPPSTSIEDVTEASIEAETEPEPAEEMNVVEVEEQTSATTVVEEETTTNPPAPRPKSRTEAPIEIDHATTEREKHTFRPLPMTVPPAGDPELAYQKAGQRGPGFWNRFQPNRWFESIHYVTNTGK
ncbi:hypothetical protein Q1695_001965 [Nippostrongylus brasiliensis]|nr:hypothetical protein Q1695_001965 [Nippostrongylus brasiliensis]